MASMGSAPHLWPQFGGNARATGQVASLGPVSSAVAWKFATGGAVYCSPAVGADGAVYFTSLSNNLYAVEGASGALRWSKPFAAQPGQYGYAARVAAPTLGASTLFLGSSDSSFYALDLASGATLWSYATGGAIVGGSALGNDLVFFGSWDYKLYALTAATGAFVWAATLCNPIVDAPVFDASSGALFVTCGGVTNNNPNLYRINPATGATVWSITPSTTGVSGLTPLSVDASGNVYFGSNGNFDPQYYTVSVQGAFVLRLRRGYRFRYE